MIINAPTAAQIPALRRLWQQAFGDTDLFLDGFFAKGFQPDRCRCVSIDGQIAGALYWFDCRWQDRPVAYLYAVATDSAFRNRGLCRSLMEDTHKHLKSLDYAGAVLVPGDPGLFRLYEKLGYTPFCLMTKKTATSGPMAATMTKICSADYLLVRQRYLPSGSVRQDVSLAPFLDTFTCCYEGETFAFCGATDGKTFHFQEYCGDITAIGGILTALGMEDGAYALFGTGTPTAMYLGLTEEPFAPQYFSIPMN